MPQLIHTQPNPHYDRWMSMRGSAFRVLNYLVVVALMVVLILRTLNSM